MGRDGATGTAELKAAGGIVIAQSEDSAEQPSMPRAAAEAGADLVLPLHEIAGVVADVVRGGPLPRPYAETEAVREVFAGPSVMEDIARYTVPEDGARHREALERTMRGEGDLHTVTRVLHPASGELIWMEAFATLVRAEDGTPWRVVGVGINVTERKRAEAALRRSEEALRESESRQAFPLRLADALRPLTDPVAIQQEATRLLREHLGAARVAWLEMASKEPAMLVTAEDATATVPRLLGRPFPGAGDDPGAPERLRRGEAVGRDDVEAAATLGPEARAAFAAAGARSWLLIPLTTEGRLAAGLMATFGQAHAWTPLERGLLEETADRTVASFPEAVAALPGSGPAGA